ncbi:ATP-dependent DNA helicase UvrD2 [Frankia sp. CNm7]|uniref:DNA 3'-5' helicase n=1 Tax=Frankia nepalensis TaxID=1836974 RepID=A0A937RWK6_9ACTN|nr:ATP-dependent DNA helicase UvrD2 [Frankia nepalensis]MBL7500767.1 ATP-dependent DNA helicase UvrD2 [Frankia nepalensis]MBL7511745.1 ATP-dependent DNA helicase UvrD2 [Frankia nepalensis]MBL7521329.1 ATP-dependent DNA helicase UvrD2 [Frankia nepalensis]MBL7633161.1 ATP-dependent DNA helicase UvrD2 [Frankia nepalensis]
MDPEQLAAVLAPVGPVCILAGAGTGKTRTITHRITRLVAQGIPGDQVLAVTFTNRAAGELRARLRAMGAEGVQARTFHAAALRQLGYFWPKVAGAALPGLVESRIPLVAKAASRSSRQLDRSELRDLAAEIEWAKATMVTPEDYPRAAEDAGRETSWRPEAVAQLYADYERAKRAAGALDFDDLLLLTAAVIEEHGWVATELRSRYRHFVVDEYQDVNPLQQRVLDAWLGGRDSLCVVGDPYQTIYSFSGASPRYLVDFPRRYPAATVVRLVRDYRSTPQVVGLANALLDAATGNGPGSSAGTAGGTTKAGAPAGSGTPAGSGVPSRSAEPTGEARKPVRPAHGRARLVAMRPPGPEPTVLECADEAAEAKAVVARIRALLAAGVPASEIAVLYRINAASEAYEEAIGAAGLPYLVKGGERFFDRPEVRDAIRLLRAAVRSAETDRPEGLADTVADVLRSGGWRATAPVGGAERERFENLAALHRLAVGLAAAEPAAGLERFVAELADRVAHQHVPTVEGVTLASLHAAKGLEWDAVFLVGLVDGMVPIVHAQTDEEIEEERRLLYVGITRARVHLTLSWALARAEGGRPRRRSRFLDALRPARARAVTAGLANGGDAPGGAARGRARGAVHCRVCGQALTGSAARAGRCASCPSQVDRALLDRLRRWRAAKAEELSRPAFVVLTDATLEAIAERRPRTVAELVALPGIGQVKLDTFGADVLALVAGRPAPRG